MYYRLFLNCIVYLCTVTVILTDAAGAGQVMALKEVTKHLGKDTDFQRYGDVLLANSRAWGTSGKDGEFLCRRLKGNIPAELLFAAFDVDERRFCKHDMILEIFYRDDFKAREIRKHRVKGRVTVQSRIDFAYDKQYVEVGHLEAKGDGHWKLGSIFFELNPRQMIRAIDGSFHFKISTSLTDSGGLPISYFRLRSVDKKEFLRLRKQDRTKRGLRRVEYQPKPPFRNKEVKTEKHDFAIYPVNYLELIFPNSAVKYDRLDSPLECFELQGEVEPISFVIHAVKDLVEVRVVVSELQAENGKISSDNIEVRRVVYNDQRWGWAREKRYGTCPDYLSFKSPVVDIKAGTNCQFWLTINVPSDANPGSYKGTVEVWAAGKKMSDIPLSVKVLSIKLNENGVKHMVYHSPHYKSYSRDPSHILRDMRDHGLTPILYPSTKIERTPTGFNVGLDDFENQLHQLKAEFKTLKTVFIGLSDYYTLINLLQTPKPFKTQHPSFNRLYGDVLQSYNAAARKHGVELFVTFQDEPFGFPDRRRVAYLCSSIAKAQGLKTWSTHWVQWDKQLPLEETEIRAGVNYLRPLREVLDVLAEGVARMSRKAVQEMRTSNSMLAYYTTSLDTSVRPLYSRLLHGWYPFVVNTDYVICYAYRDSLVDPYDDLDCRADLANRVGGTDFLLTYPTWKGNILPTLSYEALREGVEDSRLINTLRVLIKQALESSDAESQDLGKKAEKFLDNTISGISMDFYHDYWTKHKDLPVDPMEKRILEDLQGDKQSRYEIFNELRWQVCEYIIGLSHVLDKR